MKRSNRLVILVGVLLAVLAFVLIVIMFSQTPSGGDGVEEPATETVLVTTEDIDIGEPVTQDKVTTREVPLGGALETPLRDPSQVQGQASLYFVEEGSQITAEALGVGDQIDLNALLRPGEKAIAFQVDRATGADFLVTPGDFIDVVLAQQINVLQETADSAANTDADAPPRFEVVTGLENQRTVKAILQDKRVLYVSGTKATQPEPQDTNGDGVIDENDVQPEQAVLESVIVVFAGTDADAEVIKYAQNDFLEFAQQERRTLSLTVRHAEDDAIEETPGVTIDQLVERYGLLIPSIVEQLNEEAPQ